MSGRQVVQIRRLMLEEGAPAAGFQGMESRNWSRRRLWQGTLVLVAAVGLGAGVTRAFAGSARAAPPTPPPPSAATGPAQTPTVTPKTESPAAAETLSKAFATTAKALRPSVVRLDVEMGPALSETGHEGHRGGHTAPSPFSGDEPEGLPPELKRFF